jgi:hypothetical protein
MEDMFDVRNALWFYQDPRIKVTLPVPTINPGLKQFALIS